MERRGTRDTKVEYFFDFKAMLYLYACVYVWGSDKDCVLWNSDVKVRHDENNKVK